LLDKELRGDYQHAQQPETTYRHILLCAVFCVNTAFIGTSAPEVYICEVNSKIEAVPQTKNDQPPRPEMTAPQAKNGLTPQTKNDHQTLQDITLIKNKEKEKYKNK
jgi:hypothetical protein